MPYNEWGDIDKEKELYQRYYETSKRNNEWSENDKREISEEIEKLKEIDSWNSMGS